MIGSKTPPLKIKEDQVQSINKLFKEIRKVIDQPNNPNNLYQSIVNIPKSIIKQYVTTLNYVKDYTINASWKIQILKEVQNIFKNPNQKLKSLDKLVTLNQKDLSNKIILTFPSNTSFKAFYEQMEIAENGLNPNLLNLTEQYQRKTFQKVLRKVKTSQYYELYFEKMKKSIIQMQKFQLMNQKQFGRQVSQIHKKSMIQLMQQKECLYEIFKVIKRNLSEFNPFNASKKATLPIVINNIINTYSKYASYKNKIQLEDIEIIKIFFKNISNFSIQALEMNLSQLQTKSIKQEAVKLVIEMKKIKEELNSINKKLVGKQLDSNQFFFSSIRQILNLIIQHNQKNIPFNQAIQLIQIKQVENLKKHENKSKKQLDLEQRNIQLKKQLEITQINFQKLKVQYEPRIKKYSQKIIQLKQEIDIFRAEKQSLIQTYENKQKQIQNLRQNLKSMQITMNNQYIENQQLTKQKISLENTQQQKITNQRVIKIENQLKIKSNDILNHKAHSNLLQKKIQVLMKQKKQIISQKQQKYLEKANITNQIVELKTENQKKSKIIEMVEQKYLQSQIKIKDLEKTLSNIQIQYNSNVNKKVDEIISLKTYISQSQIKMINFLKKKQCKNQQIQKLKKKFHKILSNLIFLSKRLQFYHLNQINKDSSKEKHQNSDKFFQIKQPKLETQLNELKNQIIELKIILKVSQNTKQVHKQKRNQDKIFQKIKSTYEKQIEILRGKNLELSKNLKNIFFQEAGQFLLKWSIKFQENEETKQKKYLTLLNMYNTELTVLEKKEKDFIFDKEKFYKQMKESEDCFHSIVQNLMQHYSEDQENQFFHQQMLRIRKKNQNSLKALKEKSLQLKNVVRMIQKVLGNEKDENARKNLQEWILSFYQNTQK